MKLWKSKKSATTSCVSAVSGKLNLGGNKNGYKDDDQAETISATPTNQSTVHLPNGLHQGERLSSILCGVAIGSAKLIFSVTQSFSESKISFQTFDSPSRSERKTLRMANYRMNHRRRGSLFKFSVRKQLLGLRQPCDCSLNNICTANLFTAPSQTQIANFMNQRGAGSGREVLQSVSQCLPNVLKCYL